MNDGDDGNDGYGDSDDGNGDNGNVVDWTVVDWTGILYGDAADPRRPRRWRSVGPT